MRKSVDPMMLLTRLAAGPERGACSDGERLAARQALRELRGIGRRGVRTQTIWVRPAEAAAGAAIALGGVLASLLSVDHPTAGLLAAAAAVLALAGEQSGRARMLRRLTIARATQNVVSEGSRPDAPVRLIITAGLDTPRAGFLDRDGIVPRAIARTRNALGGRLPGRYGVLLLLLLAIAACAGARGAGHHERWLGAVQLAPTLLLLLLAALLADAATAPVSRSGAGASASAAAVALALIATLDRHPPRALAVDLVLGGAGSAGALGLQHWIAEQRRAGVRHQDVAVLHIAACGRGHPVWWTRDGTMLSRPHHAQLTAIAARVARDDVPLGARPRVSRRTSGASLARAAGWPAVAVGADGADTSASVDPTAVNATLQLALGVVMELDAELADRSPPLHS